MRALTPRKRKQARAGHQLGVEDCLDRVEAATAAHLAASNERIDAIEVMSNKVTQDIRDLRILKEDDSKFLHQRIDAVQRDLSDRISDVHGQLTTKIDENAKDLRDHFDVGLETVVKARTGDGKRIRSLEAWRMTIIGAGGVLSFIAIDVIVRFFGTPLADFFTKFLLGK